MRGVFYEFYIFYCLIMTPLPLFFFFFFFNDPAPTEIYPLPLHDALPIFARRGRSRPPHTRLPSDRPPGNARPSGHRGLGFASGTRHTFRAVLHRPTQALRLDRKSTRLNSSHLVISYAVFCLKKKTIMSKTILSMSATNSLNRTTRGAKT